MPSAAEIERAIRKTAAEMGAPELANLLVAISRRESGLGQNNVGDNGDSIGPFQENINGRGKGLSHAARMDPVASTKRAIAEIKTVMRANPKADPGTIAILAQRPAEELRANYRADINAQVQRTGAQVTDGTRPSTGQRLPSAAARTSAAQARRTFGGMYAMPVDGTVTNAYGGKQTYSAGKTSDIGSFNNGVDIGAPAGTTVRAPVGGVVKKIYDTRYDDRKGQRNAEENSGWGGQIVIQGDDGKEHRLSHAQYGSIAVKEGQRIEQGQPTHKVGMSGNATGPHVDWEKWSGGKSEDALKSALMPSSAGAKAYQEAIARQRATAAARPTPDKLAPGTTRPTPDKLNPDGTPQQQDMAGGADVGATAGAAGQPNAAVAQAGSGLATMYQGLIKTTEDKLTQSRTVTDELQRELSGLQMQVSAAPKDKQGNILYPPGVKNRIEALQGPKDKPGTGLIGKQLEVYKDLEQARDGYLIHYATATETAKGKVKTPEELEHDAAATAKIKLETEALRKKLEGTDPDDALARDNIRSTIAAREAEIAQRDRSYNIQAGQLQLEAARNPSVIRGTNARAAADEWGVAESMEMLPYNIDRLVASTDLDTEQATRLRESLPAFLEGMWTDIWAKQMLTPQELELGKANTDLTRQRANEIRTMMGPNLERLLAAAGIDRANAAKITQMLPLEIADLTSQTQFRQKQTELLGVTAGKTGEETRLTRYQADAEAERQRRWGSIEKQIRENPNMGQGDLDALVLGAANGIQEWSTAYRAQLERQVAQSEQQLKTQQLGISQQSADSDVRNQRMTEALGLEQNRVNQVNSATAALSPGQQGPMRRMAQLGAMAPLVGSEGLRGVAMANRMGQMDLGPIQAGYKKFEEMMGGIRGSAPDVRMAPNVTAPNPITMRFTPPTAAASNPAGAGQVYENISSAAPTNNPLGTTGGSTSTAITDTLAPTIAPITPGFTPPLSEEQLRGRAGIGSRLGR